MPPSFRLCVVIVIAFCTTKPKPDSDSVRCAIPTASLIHFNILGLRVCNVYELRSLSDDHNHTNSDIVIKGSRRVICRSSHYYHRYSSIRSYSFFTSMSRSIRPECNDILGPRIRRLACPAQSESAHRGSGGTPGKAPMQMRDARPSGVCFFSPAALFRTPPAASAARYPQILRAF